MAQLTHLVRRPHLPARRHPTAQAAGARRMTLPDRVGYAVAAAVIGLGLFASVTPSPLYRTYSAALAFLAADPDADLRDLRVRRARHAAARRTRLRRRRPPPGPARRARRADGLDRALLLADSAAWLFVARGLQGLATGAALSAASAALLDLHPRRDPAGVGLTNGVASPPGIGLGILVSSSLVQLGTAPRVLPVPRAASPCSRSRFAGAYWMPEPVARRSRFRLTLAAPERPAGRPPPVRPRRARRALVLVDRRPLLLARPAARRRTCSTRRNVIVVGHRHRRAGRRGGVRPARVRPHRAVDRRQRGFDRARSGCR